MRGTKTYSPYITPKKIRRHFWGTLIFASSSSSSSSFPPTQMIYPCPAAAAAKGTERGGGWNGPTDAAIIIFLFEIPECEFPHLFLSKKKGEGGCAAAPKLPFCAEKWVLFSSQRRLYPNHFSRRPNEQDKHKSRQTVKNGDFKDHR